MRIIFFGTPQYAAPVLVALLDAGHQVVAVVTQPDTPGGRGQQRREPPVKEVAHEQHILVLQPPSLRAPEAVAQVAALTPDALVVAAYGKLLPSALLSVPLLGALNIHPSLLPRHRGPSPVAATILAGDEVAGATIMLLDEGMDTGPILAQELLVPTGVEETTGTLTPRLFRLGAQLLGRTLEGWVQGEIEPVPQDEAQATVSHRLRKEDGALNFAFPALQLCAQVRAYQPWPGSYTYWAGQMLKILEAVPVPPPPGMAAVPAGQVVLMPPNGPAPVAVSTSQGLLGVRRLQIAGKRSVLAEEFLHGYPEFPGVQLPS